MCSAFWSVPLLHFLDRFSNDFGENKALGEEFVTAVVGIDISVTDKVPCIRAALVVTNRVAKKVVDDIARLLTKSDIERLKSKAVRKVAGCATEG